MPNITDKPYRRVWAVVRVGVYCVVFGILMGLRNEFEQNWMKDVIAGCAFVFLGLAVYEGQMWRRRQK